MGLVEFLWETCVLMGHFGNIWFLEPNFMKYEKQILMWKVIYFFMHSELTPFFVLRLAPLGLQVSNILESMLAQTEIELLKNTKIKI